MRNCNENLSLGVGKKDMLDNQNECRQIPIHTKTLYQNEIK